MTVRDSYADVGAATRAAIEQALRECRFGRQPRILLATIHQTSTWSRLCDTVYADALFELARVDRRDGQRGLNELVERGVIVWRPAHGRGRRSLLGLPGSVPVDNPLLMALPDPEKAGRQGHKRRVVEPPLREGPRRSLPNPDALECTACGQVTVLGSSYGSHWFCPRHEQAV